jgi:hypothetical protein
MMGLQFKIIYKQGKENLAADALSRVAHLMSLQAVSVVQPQWMQEVLNSYATDSHAQQLLSQLALNSPDARGYSLDQGIIRHHDLIWIGHNTALQTKLISAFHSSAISGHLGVNATYHKLKAHFSWKGMKLMWRASSSSVTFANITSTLPTTQLGYYSPSQSQKVCGRISLWISLKPCLNVMATLSY